MAFRAHFFPCLLAKRIYIISTCTSQPTLGHPHEWDFQASVWAQDLRASGQRTLRGPSHRPGRTQPLVFKQLEFQDQKRISPFKQQNQTKNKTQKTNKKARMTASLAQEYLIFFGWYRSHNTKLRNVKKKKKKTPKELKESPGKDDTNSFLFEWSTWVSFPFCTEKDGWDGSPADFHRTCLIFVEGQPKIKENI